MREMTDVRNHKRGAIKVNIRHPMRELAGHDDVAFKSRELAGVRLHDIKAVICAVHALDRIPTGAQI